jgi:hypothetical protein
MKPATKIITICFLTLSLSACALTNYDEIKISTAQVTDVKVQTLTDENVTLSFNYQINDFSPIEDLYECKIRFEVLAYDTSASYWRPGMPKCILDKSSGEMSYSSRLPEDNKYMKFPKQPRAFVIITQKTGISRMDVKVIAKSKVLPL